MLQFYQFFCNFLLKAFQLRGASRFTPLEIFDKKF